MKRDVTKTEHSRMNRRFLIVISLLCIIGPLLNLPDDEVMGARGDGQAVPVKDAGAKTPHQIEYDVKAAFIFNFMKFIEWPKPAEKADGEPGAAEKRMQIGILGDNPFGDAFEPVLDKEVHGQKILLVKIPGFSSFYESTRDKANAFSRYHEKYKSVIDDCNVLFICDSEKNHLKELLLLGASTWTLTVSDIPEFAQKGGIIGFVKDNNKIRFEINLTVAQKENLKIRAQLLTLAKTVYDGK